MREAKDESNACKGQAKWKARHLTNRSLDEAALLTQELRNIVYEMRGTTLIFGRRLQRRKSTLQELLCCGPSPLICLAELGALDVESEMSVALRSVTSSCTCACGIMLPPAMTDVEVALDCQGQRISVERGKGKGSAVDRADANWRAPCRSSRPNQDPTLTHNQKKCQKPSGSKSSFWI